MPFIAYLKHVHSKTNHADMIFIQSTLYRVCMPADDTASNKRPSFSFLHLSPQVINLMVYLMVISVTLYFLMGTTLFHIEPLLQIPLKIGQVKILHVLYVSLCSIKSIARIKWPFVCQWDDLIKNEVLQSTPLPITVRSNYNIYQCNYILKLAEKYSKYIRLTLWSYLVLTGDL